MNVARFLHFTHNLKEKQMNIGHTLEKLVIELRELGNSLQRTPAENSLDFSQVLQNIQEISEDLRELHTRTNSTISDEAEVVENQISTQVPLSAAQFDEMIPEKETTSETEPSPENSNQMKNNNLVIRQNIDGSASIDFGGGAYHHVSGGTGGSVKALLEAYGERVSNII